MGVTIPERDLDQSAYIGTLTSEIRGPQWRLGLMHNAHRHRLIFVTRGQGRIVMGGARRGIGANNLISIPPRALVSLELSRASLGFVAALPGYAALPFPDTPLHLRLSAPAQIGELTSLFDACSRELREGAAHSTAAVEAYALLMSVFVHRSAAAAPMPRLDASARLTARFFEEVVAPGAEARAMQDHAAALDVTPTHLSRSCKTSTGKTAAEILTEFTLHQARGALIETPVPIQNIAASLGFRSAAYFSRFVQTHTGTSPSGLRKAASA